MYELKFDKVYEQLNNRKTIIYGAGYNGKLLYDKLTALDIKIDAFYDDDNTRWGSFIEGIPLITYEEFISFAPENTNVIISSLYVGKISHKLELTSFQYIFSVIVFLLEKDNQLFKFKKYAEDMEYLSKLDKLIDFFGDDESKRYLLTIKQSVMAGNASERIVDCYSEEEQYFLSELIPLLNGGVMLDAGAYTGDTVKTMCDKGIGIKRVYCFEAEHNNYIRLSENIQRKRLGQKVVCENFALWDCETQLKINISNFNSAVDEKAGDEIVPSTTIDKYFASKKLDFIKMDIEGAEQRAIRGGIRTIKRDRPILAISIYHSLEDVTDIPLFFIQELKDYEFCLKCHSMTYSEVILYGIPKEKIR